MDEQDESLLLSKSDREARNAVLMMGYTYLQFHQDQRAATLLAGLNAMFPDDITILPLLAYSQIRSSKADEALVTLDNLERLNWKTEAYYLLKAQALQELNDHVAARQAYQEYRLHKQLSLSTNALQPLVS